LALALPLLLVSRMKHALAVVLLVVAPSIPRPSGACSPVEDDYGPHVLDPTASTDSVAPTETNAYFQTYRSDGGSVGCANSCGGGFNTIQLSVDAGDDRTPPNRMGYRFAIVGGQPPPSLLFPVGDRISSNGDFNWRFDSSFHGSFSFDVEIRAVDLNGNVGAATTVTIKD